MRTSHGENVRRAIDQAGGERLAAQITDVYAIILANLNGIQAGRLSAHGMNPGGGNLDVLAIAD